MQGVRPVTSNQDDIYKDLETVVRKYATTDFLRPVADHTQKAFAETEFFIEEFYAIHGGKNKAAKTQTVILDSGCGTGESTLHLARRFPQFPVIGIDKSALRLNRAGKRQSSGQDEVPPNVFWVRAELLDFWKLALNMVKTGRWQIPYHALFYPNPWPKQSEATRRFHLHPIFPTLMQLSTSIELRTNWEIYAREFAKASETLAKILPEAFPFAQIKCSEFSPQEAQTAFERKYKEARQQLWRVLVNVNCNINL